MMNRKRLSLLLSVFLLLSLFSSFVLGRTAGASSASDWVPVWNDEFNGPNGSGPDSSKWNLETGAGGWGNNELQHYTSRTSNAYQENGNLVIQALKENYNGSGYTSARLTTQNKFNLKYGRVEMRAKLPYGKGIWPAFWMLGKDIGTVGWPASGEIDIMEYVGALEPNRAYGTLHGPGYSGCCGLSGSYLHPQNLSNDYHTFALEWEPGVFKWFVDGKLFHTRTLADAGTNAWVFDKEFFFLLNLAVGGNWPGYPDGTTVFPQKYYIDYVRVWQRAGGYNVVALKSEANGKYVTAEHAGASPLIARSQTVSGWEKFELVDLGGGKAALRALINNRYVSADNAGGSPLIANRETIGTWETFELGKTADGKQTLKALANNQYVCADNEGASPLIANRATASKWESFVLVKQNP
ncbi:family 16 glycosylhydrolase [Paenibacillus sp. RC84]|uniref:family 16 glycosylhydrolase n=1 Tax=Paenibacillus sp. RC84 TaxID=3156252 RepID=UPI003512BC88